MSIKTTEEILDALEKAKGIKKSILENIMGVASGSKIKDMIVAGYLSLAIQHHSSIVLLIKKNLHSSAGALFRPLVEATYRGIWFALIASDKQIEEFNAKKLKFKKTYELAEDIDGEIDGETFHNILKHNSPIMNGMTHGGIEQIWRQFSEKDRTIIPSFKDEELIELIHASSMNLSIMLLYFGMNIKNEELTSFARKLIVTQ